MSTGAQFDISLDGKSIDEHVGEVVTDVTLETSVEQSSTVTIVMRDAHRKILGSGVFDHDEDGRLDRTAKVVVDDDAMFRVAGLQKTGDELTLAAEDETIASLRDKKGPVKPKQGTTDVTMARTLVAAVGATLVTPTGQPATASSSSQLKAKDARASADATRERGIATGANLTVKGVKATASQKQVGDAALSRAQTNHAPETAQVALISALIVESVMGADLHHDLDSEGVLAVRRSTGQKMSPKVDGKNQTQSVDAFLLRGFTGRGGAIALAKAHPDWTAGQIAQAVQGSALPGEYDKRADEARKWVSAYTGPANGSSGGQRTSTGTGASSSGGAPFVGVGPHENYWQALTRMASEHNKRCFAIDGKVFYGREQDLIASRPIATLKEFEDGVDFIDWEWLPNKPINTATVSCRFDSFSPKAGAVVTVDNGDPADGRWLISSVSRKRFSVVATVELRRGTDLLQPDAVKQSSTSSTSAASKTATPGSKGATGTAGGSWKYASGVPKTLNSKMRSFLDRMATFYDGTLVVTTTTNHSYLTDSQNVSDHNGGGAADFGSNANWGGEPDGPGGFKIAIAAYRACGLSYAEARTKANTPSYTRVPCKEYPRGVQILWRVKGHHDHVHVGGGA